ncbi:hypothetical protein J2Z32_000242 [Paenibacillus turicensis]|uniref:DUF5704 domain-containing protein n=1 Tax=Paenibacillus turicensis TaxID=160487 RepID=A0ABS4FM32_9BACL|nr:DUF5704 domain-containing protein [Paenibacillus turicensis]MBP1903630.1 hypothetical protein [Paenibacillus turicensis]
MKLIPKISAFMVLVLFILSFPLGQLTNATAAEEEQSFPIKKISDFEVNGDVIRDKKTQKDERYKGKISGLPDTFKMEYQDGLFTAFPTMQAELNEDAGQGNIITKIEFLEGTKVVKTQNVEQQKFNNKVSLTGEEVLVVSKDNETPSGATIAFQRSGNKWVMSKSSSWYNPLPDKAVKPTKKKGSNMDAYPGTFIQHRADFPRQEPYKSEKYPGVDRFNEDVIDHRETTLKKLNQAITDPKSSEANVKVAWEKEDIRYPLGIGVTDKTTTVYDLKVPSLGRAYVFFTQFYDHPGYEHGSVMFYLSAYQYTIKSNTYRYPDRIKVYYKKGKDKPKPSDPKCTDPIPAQTVDGRDLDPAVRAEIKADTRGGEQFNVLQGIPTSESLYGNVFAKNYLYQNKFVQMTGKCTFEVTVNKTFTLQWEETTTVTDANGNSTEKTETKTKPQTVTKTYEVKRPFSYWIIDNLEVYQIDEARLRNYAFDGEEISISPQNYDPPLYSTEETGGYEAPDPPSSIDTTGGVILGEDASGEEFPEDAENAVDKVRVTNDTFTFEGTTIMDGAQTEESGPTPGRIQQASQIGKDVLYSPYNMIPTTKTNKANQPSTGTIFYGLMSGNINGGENKEYPINGINSVTVHTPVVLYPSVSDDQAHNQKTEPAQHRSAIILERPFTVHLPNRGQHTNYKGYGTRDYGKYVRDKQVKFPFDVYDVFRTTFYPKGTWIDVASYEEEVEFYLPVWVDEGFYDVEMRTFAENAPENPSEQTNANLDLTHHVAKATVPVDVVGRLYDFHVTDIADFNWESVFRMEQGSQMHTGNSYWVGQGDIDGDPRYTSSQYTLPLRPGSHPVFKNLVTKTGYHFKFELKTKGNMFSAKDGIEIVPRFYFIPLEKVEGNPTPQIGERVEVDLYYHTNDKYFIQIGSKEDKESRYVILNERLRNVPQVELEDTARYQYDVEKSFSEVNQISRAQYLAQYKDKTTKQKTMVGGYGGLFLSAPIRTYIGPKTELPTGVDPYRANAAIQKWYGEYSIPAGVYAVEKGTNIAEYGRTHQGLDDASPIFLKEGYIVVNFDLRSVQNGQRDTPHLQYIQGKLMNQWSQMEGFKKDVIDPYGRTLPIQDGDVIYYDGKYSSRSDFVPMVTH